MSQVYDKFVELAFRLLDKYGQTAQLVTVTTEVNPDKPWETGPTTEVTTDVRAVFLKFNQKYVDGEAIRKDDLQVVFPAKGVTVPPDVSGFIQRGSQNWKIIQLVPIQPADQVILYKAQVRR